MRDAFVVGGGLWSVMDDGWQEYEEDEDGNLESSMIYVWCMVE